MSSGEASASDKTDLVFCLEHAIEESSEDPPMEEWSSLEIEVTPPNEKITRFHEGLYDPGSGEVCAKYIAMSDSAVFIHPYYNYPPITDPGIEEALFDPPKLVVYPEDGQKTYLAICKEMNQCPVRCFYRGLLDSIIDMKYYCVNPYGVHAMALALQHNRTVKVLKFIDNFLNDDASYHLGQMLTKNSCLYELNLSGCRIGASGAQRLFAGLSVNRTLKVLNLNKNQLGDLGAQHLAYAITFGIDIEKVYLSSNQIGSQGAAALATAFETYNKFVVLDLSWNNFYSPIGIVNLLSTLQENKNLQELYLSWNSLAGLRLGQAISNAIRAPNLCHLDLSNNKLSGVAITELLNSLVIAKKMVTLDLSYNPLSTDDAMAVLSKVKLGAVKVQKVFMENVFVDSTFLALLTTMKAMKLKKNTIVTYGGLKGVYKSVGADPRELVLNRADYLTNKQKRKSSNIAMVALQLAKDNIQIMHAKDFITMIETIGLPLDEDLIDEIINVFSGPKAKSGKTINIRLLSDYIRRKWPDRKLPPTPPPEPEPEPEPIPEEPVKKQKVKEAKKKGKK